ncbi:MAG: hypothetical protein J4A00_05995 [Gammaproteobacteria bacterium]|nr:hypothetical protein [Gammaproteobacteria bacterium]
MNDAVPVTESGAFGRVIKAGLVLLLLCFAPLAGAIDQQGQHKMHGIGSLSCAEYLVARRGVHGGTALFMEWLAGYVSAINQSTALLYDAAGGVGRETLLEWLDGYCQAHAQSLFGDAAFNLLYQLEPLRQIERPD